MSSGTGAAPAPILFYGHTGGSKYACFSNFYPAPFSLDGHTWPTTEHYFQAAKFPAHAQFDCIRLADSPAKAKTLGRSRAAPLRPDWEEIKVPLMRKALLAKFSQHAALQAVLLGTGDAHIAEAGARALPGNGAAPGVSR